MWIGCISDTHIPVRARRIPEEALRAFEGVDAILHAGDMTCLEAIEPLERIARVIAVRGNMDGPEVAARFEARVIVPAGDFRIGLVHGSGMPQGLARRVRAQFEAAGVDAVVFGHSHVPLAEKVDGMFMFNPGSPTDRGVADFCSVGLLRIDEEITGQIIRLP